MARQQAETHKATEQAHQDTVSKEQIEKEADLANIKAEKAQLAAEKGVE